MNLSQIISAARAFLPAGSPLLQNMERAQEMAGRFSASPDGVRDLMAKLGKNQDDLRRALAMLDNPMVSGMINRIAPGMVESIRSAGGQLVGGNAVPSMQPMASASPAPAPSQGADPLSALKAKLSRL